MTRGRLTFDPWRATPGGGEAIIKFIHAADIHLDSPLRGLDRYEGAPVAECRGAARRALENLVRLAIEEKVAFVLIVGDLYDGDWPDYNTGLFFGLQMDKLRAHQIKVVLIRGNHDAQNKMTRDLRLPDNVHLLSEAAPETLPLDPYRVMIHGQSFATQAVTDNLAKTYPDRARGWFNIGMLHTSVNGREGHEHYAPCTLDDLRARQYQYWALGHIHKPEKLYQNDPVIAFPGNIQGRHVGESGAKGCLLVTVDDDHEVVAVEPRALDVVRWTTCRLDAAGALDGDDLLGRFRDRLVADWLPAAEDRLLALRVEVTGRCKAHAALAANWPRWTAEIRQTANAAGDGRVWVEKVVSRTRPEVVLDDAADGPLAELAAFLAELSADDDRLREFCDSELGDLRKKLDPDLLADLDPRALLDQIGPLLRSRLNARAGA